MGFRIELDMLELQHRPRLNEDKVREQLETLDIQAWDTTIVAPLLHEIANSLSSDAQISETLQHAERVEKYPRLSFAPALVLRERQSTAYMDLINKFLERATKTGLGCTPPWNRLLREGAPSSAGVDDAPEDETPGASDTDSLLFPLPTNEEQRQIARRLQRDPCVLVKGPPGTGKSHTIANLICHLLARGERILVTAHAPKALTVLRGLLPDDVRDLCVTALGSSREDQRLLDESVRGILRRKNEWRGALAAQQAIEDAELYFEDSKTIWPVLNATCVCFERRRCTRTSCPVVTLEQRHKLRGR
jgi:ATP-dependent exoDNAse (exonuclease V) alpha subunit